MGAGEAAEPPSEADFFPFPSYHHYVILQPEEYELSSPVPVVTRVPLCDCVRACARARMPVCENLMFQAMVCGEDSPRNSLRTEMISLPFSSWCVCIGVPQPLSSFYFSP